MTEAVHFAGALMFVIGLGLMASIVWLLSFRRRPIPPPLPEDYATRASQALKERRAQDRKDLFWDIIIRIIVGGGCAFVAWVCWPGAAVFNKGLASLTLADISGLVMTGMFGLAAFRILTGEPFKNS
jgi:hypothetical protein